jgi:hypothetical protein
MTWTEVEDALGLDRGRFRTSARRYKAEHPEEFKRNAPTLSEVSGVMPGAALPDPDEVFERACTEWRNAERLIAARANQRLSWDYGPIALVNTADWHLGGSGVDYPRLDRELHIIADTPGMFAIGAGDLLDQMIVGRLLDERKGTRLSVRDEWVLLRRELAVIAPKLVAIITGNHDNWAEALTGISYFERELADLQPRALYDTQDARVTVSVGDWDVPVRIRHKWRGSSIYNPTHGIERAAKWDHNFVIGFGAHTHRGGVCRDFNLGNGNIGVAAMAGSYKLLDGDAYARRQGFARPAETTSVAVVINAEQRSLTGFNDLASCAEYMEAVYG